MAEAAETVTTEPNQAGLEGKCGGGQVTQALRDMPPPASPLPEAAVLFGLLNGRVLLFSVDSQLVITRMGFWTQLSPWFDPSTDSSFSHVEFQIHKLQSENMQIRQQTGPAHPVAPPPSDRPDHSHVTVTATGAHRRDRHAFSMYEPGTSALKPFGQQLVDDLVGRLQPFHPGVSASVPLLDVA